MSKSGVLVTGLMIAGAVGPKIWGSRKHSPPPLMTKAMKNRKVSKIFSKLARLVMQFKSMFHGMSYAQINQQMCTFMVSNGLQIG